ncbi:hypothetical protein SAMN06295967_10944 [Belliella buryatensis]|uniref:Uncharacterized protein n=1 Tax=Belliella buryatensis TaxID=1500549 RepID=A0A239EBV9_9BACT|nr:hypothetical protein SAMN06295967_10944 [Belliella buryatensis]
MTQLCDFITNNFADNNNLRQGLGVIGRLAISAPIDLNNGILFGDCCKWGSTY